MKRLLAVVNADNQSSIRLLEKIGFKYEKMVQLSADAPEIKLYASAI
jgi:RimJ/RimL family protein N-acetyltransferase